MRRGLTKPRLLKYIIFIISINVILNLIQNLSMFILRVQFVLSFVSFLRAKKSKESTKENKENTQSFPTPCGRYQGSASQNYFCLTNSGRCPSNNARLIIAERQAKRLARLKVRACPQQQFNQNALRAQERFTCFFFLFVLFFFLAS